jgi:hypothetical protein
MRARLFALLVVGLLLAPLPALAAPDRSAHEEGAGWIEGLWIRLADTVSRLFGANEDDKGPGIDPNGLTNPPPPPSGGLATPSPEPAKSPRGRAAGSRG